MLAEEDNAGVSGIRKTAPVFAVVTPFGGADGQAEVDLAALREMLLLLWEGGARRIVVGGTTGEFCSMTLTERRGLLEAVRARFPPERGARSGGRLETVGSAGAAGKAETGGIGEVEIIAHVSATAAGDVRELL